MNSRNARNGLILFAVYLFFYGGFVFINAFAPDSMEWTPFAGLNLAVVYGFGLIFGAVILSAVYGLLCGDASVTRPAEPSLAEPSSSSRPAAESSSEEPRT